MTQQMPISKYGEALQSLINSLFNTKINRQLKLVHFVHYAYSSKSFGITRKTKNIVFKTNK